MYDLTPRIEGLRRALGVTAAQARILLMLYRAHGEAVSKRSLFAGLPCRYADHDERTEGCLRVLVAQLRKQIGARTVGCSNGYGYFLYPQGQQAVRNALATATLREAA